MQLPLQVLTEVFNARLQKYLLMQSYRRHCAVIRNLREKRNCRQLSHADGQIARWVVEFFNSHLR